MALPDDIEAWIVQRLEQARDAGDIPGMAAGGAPAARVYVGQVNRTLDVVEEYRVEFSGEQQQDVRARGDWTLTEYAWTVEHRRRRHRPDVATPDTARSAGTTIGRLLSAQQFGTAPRDVLKSSCSAPSTTFSEDRQVEAVRVAFLCRVETTP